MAETGKKQQRNGPPRLSDIAERCGVGRTTVSYVLKGIGRQSQDTIDRVMKAAEEMGYDPANFHAARQLISSRFGQRILNYTLGLSFVEVTDVTNYGVKMLQGAIKAIGVTEFAFYTYDVHRVEQSLKLPLAYRRGDIDGVLTASQQRYSTRINELLRNSPGFGNRPIVGMVEHLDGCSAVYADNYQVGYKAITHLLDLGHRHIMHFVDDYEAAPDAHGTRLTAYVDACRERGLDPAKFLHRHFWSFSEDVSEVMRLFVEDIKRHPEITAVMARHDLQALFIYDALIGAGYRIPEDISLVGSDDTDAIIDGTRENILTTVRLPLVEIGREGTNLLIRRVLGEEKEDRDIVLPVELMIRKSTAPPRKPSSAGRK